MANDKERSLKAVVTLWAGLAIVASITAVTTANTYLGKDSTKSVSQATGLALSEAVQARLSAQAEAEAGSLVRLLRNPSIEGRPRMPD